MRQYLVSLRNEHGYSQQDVADNLHAAGQDVETVTSMLEAMANQGLKWLAVSSNSIYNYKQHLHFISLQ